METQKFSFLLKKRLKFNFYMYFDTQFSQGVAFLQCYFHTANSCHCVTLNKSLHLTVDLVLNHTVKSDII